MSIVVAVALSLASGTTSDAGKSSVPASAPVAPAIAANDSFDPVVCHSFGEIGSRLKRKRVCMHRSEWEAQRQENVTMINRTQVVRGLEGGN